MKEIIEYIKLYARDVNKTVLVISMVYMAILIALNYGAGLEIWLTGTTGEFWTDVRGRIVLYGIAFFIPLLLVISSRTNKQLPISFWICAILAPILFSIKVSMNTGLTFTTNSDWNYYWNEITYWPLRLCVLFLLLCVMYRLFHRDQSFYGLKTKQVNYRPYLLMVLIMIPLIAAASTQPDFLDTYPKLRQVDPLPHGAQPGWIYKLLFELSYGSDFFSIELFFRGFLVIGMMKWLGKDAILPMACYYCSIHFGKPMGECISSFFGGTLLGIVSFHTRSIYGGLMVHLGIAWLMEAGGTIGNYLKW